MASSLVSIEKRTLNSYLVLVVFLQTETTAKLYCSFAFLSVLRLWFFLGILLCCCYSFVFTRCGSESGVCVCVCVSVRVWLMRYHQGKELSLLLYSVSSSSEIYHIWMNCLTARTDHIREKHDKNRIIFWMRILIRNLFSVFLFDFNLVGVEQHFWCRSTKMCSIFFPIPF